MYNIESYQEPFWAKSGNFVRGRDPLGVQNSSISVYATLLPGLTNLTLRLRYYGFYLWLLDEYLVQDKKLRNIKSDELEAHYTYIRRAELILAFVMAKTNPEELSVIGSNYVADHKEDAAKEGFYDIEHGADKEYQSEEHKVYWDYTSGALGQYYAGSLIGLGLVEQRKGRFRRTDDKGTVLANAFRNSVDVEDRKLFLDRVVEGKLYEEDIKRLSKFALNTSVEKKEEGQYYFEMLLRPDSDKIKTYTGEISHQRKESIQLFLNKLKESKDKNAWQQLPVLLYLDNLSVNRNDVSEASFGWYFYQLNEFTHYYLETIFWGLLKEMDSKEYALQHFLKHISSNSIQVCSELFRIDSDQSASKWMSSIELDTLENVSLIGGNVKSNEISEGIARGICGLLSLYKENEQKIEDLKYYAYNHQVHEKHGNALEVFQNYISSNLDLPLEQFIRKVVHTLMNEHISIAYYKMGNGEKNLLKFLIEDNYLVHIETMNPNFTNPRLKTLFNFMVDLRVIDKDGNILERGEELLSELNKSNV